MLQGYPALGDAGAMTVYDPILLAAVTTFTYRGSSRSIWVMGLSVGGDTPTLGNQIRFKCGNSTPDYRYVDIPTNRFDADNGLAVGEDLNFTDVGGIPVDELESFTLTAVGTGHFCATIWIEDGEPVTPIPKGNIVCLHMGGTNDCGTTWATTGFDLDGRKLENKHTYTPFRCDTVPEDKVVQGLVMKAGKNAMTLPQVGTFTYPNAPLQFTGYEYNAGQVIGYAIVQAATKFNAYIYCTETVTNPSDAPSNALPINSQPQVVSIPGASSLNAVLQVTGKSANILMTNNKSGSLRTR